MHRKTELLLAGLVAIALAACEPKPDNVDVVSIDGTQATPARRPVAGSQRLAEGDLLVVDADAEDDDEKMNLCVDATSTNPGTVRVARVQGKCRQFVVMATAAGTASVRFEVRGVVNEFAFEVFKP